MNVPAKLLTTVMTGAMLVLAPLAADAAGFDPLLPREASTVAAEIPTVVRPLPADPRDLELAGEFARRSFAVHLTAAEAASARQLRLKISERAVSVLPETANLRAFVNGREVGGAAGPELSGNADLRLALPPGLLVAGFNEVRIVAHHEHRVDCSVDGGYELWTRLDPAATGFAFTEAQPLVRGRDGITGLLQANGAPGTLRLVLPADPEAPLVDAAIHAAQTIALTGRAWRPNVAVVPSPADEPGTNILFRTAVALPVITAAGGIELAPGLWSLPRRPGAMARDLVLVAETVSALDGIARSLDGDEARTISGTRQGLAALANALGRPMADDEEVALDDFGLPGIDFAGRRMTEEVRVRLPADFFSSGYGSVRLLLHGQYVPGLTETSALRVRVNDVVAATVKLVSSGETWNGRDIELPLAMFHPGSNAVQLEAVMQTESDLVCDPAAAGGGGIRMRLGGDTSLTFPRLARVGNLPEVGATMVGYPYSATDGPVPVWAADRDRATLGAAATVATQMAVATGRPMPVSVNFRAPVATDAGGLVFGTSAALPAWLSASLTDDPAFAVPELMAGDLERFPAVEVTDPVSPSVVVNQTVSLDLDAPGDADGGLFSRVQGFRRFAQEADWTKIASEGVDAMRAKVGDLIAGKVHRQIERPRPNDLVVFQTAELPDGADLGDALFRSGSVPLAWTVFAADSTEVLAGGIAEVAAAQRWGQIAGRMAVVRGGGTQVDALPADQQVLAATHGFTVGNARLALAGWFSRNTAVYVQVMLAACVVVGALAFAYARVAGTRTS